MVNVLCSTSSKKLLEAIATRLEAIATSSKTVFFKCSRRFVEARRAPKRDCTIVT